MSVSREGGCACGEVRYRLTSDPLFVHCCHCLSCQRQTGSAFVINLLSEADRVQMLAGELRPVDVPRDDGSRQRIFRCPACQVALYSEYGRPEVRFVRAGTLDQPSGITPDVHIFTRSKLGWVRLPESVPAFEVYYDTKAVWPRASLERHGQQHAQVVRRGPHGELSIQISAAESNFFQRDRELNMGNIIVDRNKSLPPSLATGGNQLVNVVGRKLNPIG